jgi:hypothetical protein
MTRTAALLLAGLALGPVLAGCQTIEERRAAEEARDDADCRSYGARRGTPDYIRCRTELRRVRAEKERTVVVRTVRPAPIIIGADPLFGRPRIFGPDPFGPRLCRRTPFGVDCW